MRSRSAPRSSTSASGSRLRSGVDKVRLEQQLEILARARALLPTSRAPYHAHLRLRYADGREADILLGGLFRRGEGVTIIEWRTARPASPIDVELDPAQRQVVELPERETVLILGEAGCGKTTVALHRLRALRRRANERFRAACVVPNEGLRRLIESLLHRLGLDDVETWTWEKFASKQARRVFPDLRRRESENASPALMRLKRHEALRPILAQLARRPPPAEEEDGRRRAKLARREDLHALFGDRP